MGKKDGSQSIDGYCIFCGDWQCDHECEAAAKHVEVKDHDRS